jgi:hypothetical protein
MYFFCLLQVKKVKKVFSTITDAFFMAHSVEPILPFDITLATFLVPNIATPLTTKELLAIYTCQLQRHKADLAAIYANILHSHFDSMQQFECTFKNTICDHDFKPGALVLVHNLSIETDLSHKMKPCYFGQWPSAKRNLVATALLCLIMPY